MSVALSLFATFFAAQLCAAKPLREWERAADHAHVRLTGLVLPNRAEGVERLVNEAISAADGELDKISKLDGRQLSFANTAAALDFARWKVQNAANIAGLLASTSADAELRAAAMTAAKRCREWNVTSEYRDDIYRALQRFAATHPDLEPEDRRLLDKMLRDFRRAGVDLPA